MKYALMTVMTLAMIATSACQSTIRNTMYSAFETVGIEKRDILKRRVDGAKNEQKAASETFKDALETFKKVYAFDGGDLEKNYSKAKSSYEKSESEAEKVRSSIKQMDVVAGDLFKEWQQEAGRIETASLRAKSLELRAKTEKRYGDLLSALKKSESRMDPVLHRLNDQVLFLKHNLNAKAISSLQGERQAIEKDIQRLIADMQTSITEADKFIAELD